MHGCHHCTLYRLSWAVMIKDLFVAREKDAVFWVF